MDIDTRLTATEWLVACVLAMTGYRFDKSWRWAETGPRAWVYRYVVCTFLANGRADRMTHGK